MKAKYLSLKWIFFLTFATESKIFSLGWIPTNYQTTLFTA